MARDLGKPKGKEAQKLEALMTGMVADSKPIAPVIVHPAPLASSGSGKPSAARPGRSRSLYLSAADDEILKSVRVMFATEGINLSDAMIIRAALRGMSDRDSWIAALKLAQADDGRYKK